MGIGLIAASVLHSEVLELFYSNANPRFPSRGSNSFSIAWTDANEAVIGELRDLSAGNKATGPERGIVFGDGAYL
jgi:hypothetical protein